MEEQVTTAKFNVGGKLYEVSKSLLRQYPNTLLAKKASEASIFAVFIDRDPDRFGYCLDYMRDGGTLSLPETITKSSILKDLRYLGFEDIDESLIDDASSEKQQFARYNEMIGRAHLNVQEMERERDDLTTKLRYAKIALICFKKGVDTFEKEVTVKGSPWMYQGEDIEQSIATSRINGDEYFRECCSKLGMEVLETRTGFVRFRKTSPTRA